MSRFAGPLLVSVGIALAAGIGCQPPVPSAGVAPAASASGPPAPPPPPGTAPAVVAPAGIGVAGTPAANDPAADGLPADLIKQIDALIQAHQGYTALAEQMQDAQTVKQRYDELSQLEARGASALEDVMIASAKLPAARQATFTNYMDRQVTPANDIRRRQRERIQALLP